MSNDWPTVRHETAARPVYPSVVERAVRTAMHFAAIITLTLACVLMLGLIRAAGKVGDGLDRLRSPGPAVTGCPFGGEDCGG